MGQTLTIWKWKKAWPFRNAQRVFRAIEKDLAPLAIARFDAVKFANEIRMRFGGGNDAAVLVDVCDFTGNHANWIVVSCGWQQADQILELERMCANANLQTHSE